MEHSEWTSAQPRFCVWTHTAGRSVSHTESLISLIILHYLGFQAGFKEIIRWMKKAGESSQLLSASAQVDLWETCPLCRCHLPGLSSFPTAYQSAVLAQKWGRAMCFSVTHSYLRNWNRSRIIMWTINSYVNSDSCRPHNSESTGDNGCVYGLFTTCQQYPGDWLTSIITTLNMAGASFLLYKWGNWGS